MKQTRYLSYYIRLFLIQFLPNERGLSKNTLLAYRDALKLLMRYVDEQLKIKIDTLSPDDLNDDVVRNFLNYLEEVRKCTPQTRNARLAALKTFFYYLGREVPECMDNSRKIGSIVQKKVPHKAVEYLEPSELKAIMDGIDVTDRNGYRDKAMLLFMHNTGARVQEVVDVQLDDLRLDSASQVKITGKGNKQRVCPLWEETIEAIEDYLSERNASNEDETHLFLNARGESITRFGIRYIIKKYTDKAIELQPSLKEKKIGPHTLRHTTAMNLLQSGNELNLVRLWLGHVSLNTTHLYVEIDMKLKKEILAKCQPPELKEKRKKWKQPKILNWLDTFNEKEKLCEVTLT
jgi:integrase/recombinase XerD